MAARIAVCTSQTPFAHGGAEILANALVTQLRRAGHEAEVVQVPFRWYPKEEILKGYLAWRLLSLDESEGKRIDRVIALKFPAFALSHPHKTTWLIQQFRQAYDLFGTAHSHFDSSEADQELRGAIKRIDTRTIGESERILAISDNVAGRLCDSTGLEAETLHPPPALDGEFRHDGYGDYVLSLCRLNRLKRVDSLIKAMAHVKTRVRCFVAGKGEEVGTLQREAKRCGVSDRVEFLGYVSDEEALSLYANALAVYYAPLDEDYGLATVEAMKSQRPVLTTLDSGGVLEFVRDGETGFATPSGDPVALAQRIDELYGDRKLARRLGIAALESVESITWDRALTRLLDT